MSDSGSEDDRAKQARPHQHQHQHQMAVQSDPATSAGVYANLMMVSHRQEEFILDFLFVQPQAGADGQSVANLRSRVITTPEHAKRIVRALQENIQRYEAAFGVTAEATDLPRKIH
jgi:hypothetical protein